MLNYFGSLLPFSASTMAPATEEDYSSSKQESVVPETPVEQVEEGMKEKQQENSKTTAADSKEDISEGKPEGGTKTEAGDNAGESLHPMNLDAEKKDEDLSYCETLTDPTDSSTAGPPEEPLDEYSAPSSCNYGPGQPDIAEEAESSEQIKDEELTETAEQPAETNVEDPLQENIKENLQEKIKENLQEKTKENLQENTKENTCEKTHENI